LKQNQQQELLRQMRPELTAQHQYQQQLMRSMNPMNGNMPMNINKGNLARAAMANNQNNPQMQMLQQAKQNNAMQRDPSGMDANRDRPSSPASGDNAPSPSKRQRTDGSQFNPNQPGVMMQAGRPGQAMQGPPMNTQANHAAAQLLSQHGINPSSLNPQQFQHFVNLPPQAQSKSIATYSQNLQTQQGAQMGGNKVMGANGAPQNQGSPMMAQNAEGAALAAFYNANDINGPGGLQRGPGAAQAGQAGTSNHALQDYQMQLMLLEQQNKKRLMMARQEQDNMGGIPRGDGGPGGPGAPGAPGANGQPFPDASPQGMRTGTSPNPTEQMKRGTPQMNNSGIPSPVPEGGQSRGSPNNAMNFMVNQVDPNMAPHFFKGVEGNMAQAQLGGLRAPGNHPGQPFNGQMNPQMMAARQAQQQGQPGQPGQQGQPGQGNPQQWQQGPNGQMMPQGMPQGQQAQGTPQARPMPPPSVPAAAAANAASRTTASPQQAAAAPPTPNQGNKAAPKKKDTKGAKDKRAAQKKSNSNLNSGATPSADNGGDGEAPTPATPITPVTTGNFAKAGQNGAAANGAVAGAPGAGPALAGVPQVAASGPASQIPPLSHGDPGQNGMGMDQFGGMGDFPTLEMANPMHSNDVLNDFDFDSFLHDDNGGAGEPFDFNQAFSATELDGIGAD
jgi:hypothetical protein